jgi:succinate dehydrogenase / fumarate reductase, membrane anchor subunit
MRISDIFRRTDSRKGAVRHWIVQRVTAIALVPLGLWFISAFVPLITAPYEEVLICFSSPVSATCAILFILVLFYHGALGMQGVFEDYIPQESLRHVLVRVTYSMSAAVAVLAVACILKIVVDHAPGL